MTIDDLKEIARGDLQALLVSVYLNPAHRSICDEHLQELELLTNTYGVKVLEKVPCLIRKYDPSTCITSGKLEELIMRAKELNANLVIFDDEIAPSQQRNLEKAFKLPVMDRAELILEVFADRAQTKEARLQIELAKVKYQAPRLKRLWTHLSRQQGTSGGGGGGGYLKGEGEKQIEIDRRLLKRRIEVLNQEIREVQAVREQQRAQREKSGIPTFAIVGYTNAGKSTLLQALTQADVLIEDKLFATLDTTTRKFTLPNNQDILLIDTVGFIRKLPHLLVAAFKSTLEEAIQTDILLHLVDVSHPMAEEQAQTTFEVLKELNAENKPVITVLNKIDQCTDRMKVQRLKMTYPHTVDISALKHLGFDALQEKMVAELAKQRRQVKMRIPQSEYVTVSEVMRLGNIIKLDYDENDVIILADLPNALASKLHRFETV
ncbi:GTPase HflX [Chlamydiales bacterium STE3]|nr:GTPase HflX [Chlamydiales bacterium STE3]